MTNLIKSLGLIRDETSSAKANSVLSKLDTQLLHRRAVQKKNTGDAIESRSIRFYKCII